MECKKCGSNNVQFVSEQISGKVKNKRMGCLWGLGRFCLIVGTCGLWLIIGRRSGTGNIKYKQQTVAICQNCGNKQRV